MKKEKVNVEQRGGPVGRFQSSAPLRELAEQPKALGRRNNKNDTN